MRASSASVGTPEGKDPWSVVVTVGGFTRAACEWIARGREFPCDIPWRWRGGGELSIEGEGLEERRKMDDHGEVYIRGLYLRMDGDD